MRPGLAVVFVLVYVLKRRLQSEVRRQDACKGQVSCVFKVKIGIQATDRKEGVMGDRGKQNKDLSNKIHFFFVGMYK